MKFLKNLSLRSKLLLISLLPLMVFGYLLAEQIVEEYDKREQSLNLVNEFQEIQTISNLLHELQRERGIAFGYMVVKRKEFENELIDQRSRTDLALQEVQNLYRNKSKSQELLAQLDSIPVCREKPIEYLDFLNTVKWNLITEIFSNSRFTYNAAIQNDLNMHLRLMQAKEYLARIRSIVEGAILSGQFENHSFPVFAALVGQYDHSLDRFTESAAPEVKEYFESKVRGNNVTNTASMMDLIFNNPSSISAMSEEEWWSGSSTTIDLFKNVEDYSLKRIEREVYDEVDASRRQVLMRAGLGIFLTLFIGGLVLLIVSQITTSINEIKDAAEKISLGEVNFEVDEKGKDELSVLAKSFNRMMAVSKQYIEIADTIGKGDYSPTIKIRGKGDVLSKALINMKTNLHNLSVENETRTWLLSGNSDVNDAIRGDKDLPALSYDILHTTLTVLKGQLGTLYIKQNGSLELAATYAAEDAQTGRTIQVGEGLVGQAARDGKPLIVSTLPEGYIKVNSSLGNAFPTNLIIFPFHYEGEVKGVMEIGLIRETTKIDMQLLETISDNIAISIQAAQARERLKQLLDETQRQSEELVAQQEELIIANEELQQKTELLERSEEELKAQQEELQQTNEELFSKASQLELQKKEIELSKLQIEEKAQELELTNRYKSEFLANMSHELRTPLNSILILSQVLIENRSKKLSQKEIQFAHTIHNSGTDLMELINEILDLSKIEAGKMELDIDSVALQDIARHMEQSFSEVAKQKSIDFEVLLGDEISNLAITSDIQRIEQIIKNFLSNAFKFTDPGGRVELTLKRSEGGRNFKNEELAGKNVVAFVVSDSGVGIPPDKLGPIFEAFQQGDGSTKRKYGGTGLGLSISKELANLLGGEIHVSSKVDEGSKFTLYLPEEYHGPALHSTPDVKISVPIAGKDVWHSDASFSQQEKDFHEAFYAETDRKIVIMEGDAEFASMLMKLVQERKYKPILARHGIIGLNYVRHYKPDAIILNMNLEGMNGEEILRHLKKDPQLRHIPVQVISPGDEKTSIAELGAFDVIRRPLSRENFWRAFDRIEEFVSRKLKKLLIVEDNETHSEAIQALIGNGDVKCYSAYSGESAYALLTKEPFDCIIVDLGLPGMTGFEFLEKLKDNPSLNYIPVIVYTGRNLSREESARLEKLSSAIVLKTAFSHERLLDETTLFLHRVESRLPKEKQHIIRKLHKTDQILKNKKVLIADDDVRNVYSLVAAFEQEGLICVTAENGRAALEKLKDHPDISIAMMDVMMPEMDGYEATREIRRFTEFQNLPIIALTAKAMKGDREKCLAAGMSDYVSKPINVQQLLSLMRVWLYTK